MATTASTRAGYDAVAGEYEARIGAELAGKPLERAVLAAVVELAAGGPVLDAASGPGHVAAHLATLGADVVALDLSPAMCAAARARGIPAVAGDLTALPFGDGAVAAVVCLYAVVHLDDDGRAAAYAEITRVLRPGGVALPAFHVRDAECAPGEARDFAQWWGHQVDLTFRYLDPDAELRALRVAGLELVARVDRTGDPAVEHPSERSSLLVRRPLGDPT